MKFKIVSSLVIVSVVVAPVWMYFKCRAVDPVLLATIKEVWVWGFFVFGWIFSIFLAVDTVWRIWRGRFKPNWRGNKKVEFKLR